MKLFKKFSFRQQLSLWLSIGVIVLLSVSASIQFSTTKEALTEKQLEQGLRVSQILAEQSLLSLLYESEKNASESINSILKFPDVVAAEIFRADKTKFLFSGDSEYRTDKEIVSTDKPILYHETANSWYFIAPVIHTSDELTPFDDSVTTSSRIGYVRITVSKQSLKNTVQDHLVYSLSVSAILAVVFVVIVMLLVSKLTSPIRKLVNAMKKVEEGERSVQAEVSGPTDVVKIGLAFNQMIATREAEEERIKQAHDMALEAAKMKGDFAANVSHELRTPMNGIIGMLDVLRDSGNLNPKQAEYLGVIYSSSNSLLDLINDILDFSKLDSGNIQLESEDFYLTDTVQNVIDLLEGQARRKDVELGMVMDPMIKDLVHGDSKRLRQILINLIGNAIKFTDEGHVLVKVDEVTGDDKVPTYSFEVEDTGIGIPADQVQKIYEPFAQLDTTPSSRYGGTGLGLTISRQLIEILGGSISIQSEPGKGSTFNIVLPFKSPKEGAQFNIEKHRPEVAGIRVLVVDASAISRHVLSTILTQWGAYHQSAPTGQGAITKLKQAVNKSKAFDFVIIDQEMSSMKSEDLVRQIKGDKTLSFSRVIMTVSPNYLGKSEAYSLGVDGIIEKPLRDVKLYSCITSVMNSKNSNQFKPTEFDLVARKRNVLVVEDTSTNQYVAEEILHQFGCDVDIAVNGRDAVENYFEKEYDIIFMDCRMPIMDGYQATKVYRSNESEGKRTPIVAMSANTKADEMERCLEVGMDDYLPKPITMESVKEILYKWANHDKSSGVFNDVKEEIIEDDDPTIPDFDNGPLVDSSAFTRLRMDLGGRRAVKMLQIFCEELPDQLNNLIIAVTQHDRSQAAEISHSIKGSSSNFGAESFSEMARALESASKTEEIEDLLEKAHKLNQMGYRLVQELEKIVDKEQSRLNSEIRYSVLVVEDNNTDRYSIINALGSNNLNVAEARNGTQAIKICQEKLPDLILLDVNMPEPGHPEMDGFLACRKIKEIPGAEHLPILIITSMDDSKSINKAFSAGASDYITKPINLSVLQRRVKQLLVSSHSERQIQKLAYTDPLTGLPNRPYFVEHLSRELVNPDSRGLSAVIFMGLDGFKTINDALGHEIGDILLQSVSKRLKTLSKENVVLARTGGDEFSLLVKNVLKEEDIELFAQLIRYEVSQPYYINMETISVSSSIGISVFPTHGKTVPILMKRADTALYYAKKANSGHMFYKTDMSERATRRHKVTSGLQEAIRSDQLVLYYQPQFSVEGGKVIGAEALIRWNYNNALIFPDEFIPYAEESGLIHELGEWVVLNACRQLSKWCEKGYKGIRVSINISGEQLVDQRLLNVIEESLIQSKADPRCLEIEITESSLIKNPEKCSDALNRIRAKGIEIAIDDFGTGYNNLSNLESFPIDTMKIDKSFVMPINEGSNTKTVKGIIALAKHMGYKIVAEGIETEFQKNRFSEFGCDYLQGYFISKPITADEFERKFLRKMFSPRAKVALISSANRNKK